jgi:crotonobetainyl-CoA:carnitine CoA-transferase CaiB-like acyl-CoA transferase
LSGLRVLDLTRLMPGPYATLLLADLGADVVKVEDPVPGDYLREIAPPMFAALNRGKRSVVLDLKSVEGASQLRRLCGPADVLIESFRPGVLERLLPTPWPSRLIVCRISGFGQTGPWRERAGHDIGYLALSGVLALNRGVPAVQLADLFGGAQQAAIGVLAALVERAHA